MEVLQDEVLPKKSKEIELPNKKPTIHRPSEAF